MGVAYMGSCVITQGVQGKIYFDSMNNGSSVIGQNVFFRVIKLWWRPSLNGHFEGLAAIFELYTQQNWIQHILIPLENMCVIH